MASKEDFRSAGVLPTGPVSAWPHERHYKLLAAYEKRHNLAPHDPLNPGPTKAIGPTEEVTYEVKHHAKEVEVTIGQMAQNFTRTAAQGLKYGKVSAEIREERYDMCKACPKFIEDTKRCASCGCFMEAKTWIGGDPDLLCPLKKWER